MQLIHFALSLSPLLLSLTLPLSPTHSLLLSSYLSLLSLSPLSLYFPLSHLPLFSPSPPLLSLSVSLFLPLFSLSLSLG